jgi:hypothetical protein
MQHKQNRLAIDLHLDFVVINAKEPEKISNRHHRIDNYPANWGAHF